MSLNNIELKPRMLADLYTNTLLETNTTTVPERVAPKYLGNNQKNIAIIVRNPSLSFLPDEELAFLVNILSACKLSLADIGIFNSSRMQPEELSDIIQKDSKTILLFGIDPLSIGLPINFPQFQLQQFNKRMYLYSPALSELEIDKGLKMKLWTSLKTLFGI
jgi:hypothetical protein